MAKKSNNKLLFILFGVLLAIFLATQFFKGGNERSFREELTDIDTAKISKIVLNPVAENGAEITLERSGKEWHVVKNGKRALADQAGVTGMLPQLAEMKVKRLAAASKDKWAELEVTDSAGTRVRVYEGNKVSADITIGKFSVNQQQRTFTSFARVTDETEVYAVDGFLTMTFNREYNAWRNKEFVSFNKADATRVALSGEGLNFDLQKSGTSWSLGGVSVDSTAMDSYLNGIMSLTGNDFVDDFSPPTPLRTLSIEGNNMAPIQINCYEGDGGFVLNSSLNPNAFFTSDSTGIYAKLIPNLEELKIDD